jgi:bla regulator protein blaR1
MTIHLLSMFRDAGPPIANHLWQSTAFAAAIGLLTLLFARNRARVRYGFWLAASVKFLIPFSGLIAVGSVIPLSKNAVPELQAALVSAVHVAGQPFHAGAVTQTVGARSVMQRVEEWMPAALVLVWGVGFAAVLLTWYARWRQVAKMLRRSVPADERREAAMLRRMEDAIKARTRTRLLVSSELMEPGVFGIFRPALLWPAELSDRLGDEHLEAILAHEVAHVHRRDNVAAMVHMIVEAIFWFHPLVWWIERKMVEERERACDEAVVESGSRADIYADSLLKVSRFCVELPLPCVSGITGADLSKRIRSIMVSRFTNVGIGKRLLLAALALGVVAGPVAFGFIQEAPSTGQILHAAGPVPSFEVAAIKPNHSGSGPTMVGAVGHAAPNDRFIATNITIKALICWAFGGNSVPLPSNEVTGGPSWLNSDRYDIDAKLEDSQAAKMAKSPTNDQIVQVRLMVQKLLADRFKLVAKDTMVTRPVYALVIAKGGSKMQEVVPGSKSPVKAGGHPLQFSGDRGEVSGHGVPMSFLVRFLSQEGLDRPVVDETGLKGEYDFTLKWNPDLSPGVTQGPSGAAAGAPPDTSGPLIFTAIQEQLGLKLKATEGSVEDLVIANIEKPSEN